MFYIDTLGHKDMEAAYQLHRQATYNPWSLDTFTDSTTPPYVGVVVKDNNDVVKGYALILTVVDEGTLMDIAVAKSVRGQGLGKALMKAVISSCKNSGCQSLWLEVRATNLIANTLYNSFGFSLIETRKGYYPTDDGKEDANIMKLVL